MEQNCAAKNDMCSGLWHWISAAICPAATTSWVLLVIKQWVFDINISRLPLLTRWWELHLPKGHIKFLLQPPYFGKDSLDLCLFPPLELTSVGNLIMTGDGQKIIYILQCFLSIIVIAKKTTRDIMSSVMNQQLIILINTIWVRRIRDDHDRQSAKLESSTY